MAPITDQDIEALNARSAGRVELIQISETWFSIAFDRINRIGCQDRVEFVMGDGTVYDNFTDDILDMPYGRLTEQSLERFERDGETVLVIRLSGEIAIRVHATDPKNECIVIELERNRDGIQMMIF